MRKTLGIFLHIILLFIIYILAEFGSNQDVVFRFLSVITFVAFLSSFFFVAKSRITPSFLILAITYIYNFGQVWLISIGVELAESSFAITRYNTETLNKSLIYIVSMIVLVQLFILLFSENDTIQTSSLVNDTNDLGDIDDYRRLSYARRFEVLFIIVLPFCLYFDISQIRLAASYGYADALYARADNDLLYMANCVFPLLVFGIVFLSESRRKKIISIVIGCIRYILLMLLVGYRMQAICFLCCVLIILLYGRISDKDDIFDSSRNKGLLITGLAVFVMLYLSSYAALSRRGGTNLGYMVILESFTSLIQELGGTFIDIPILMENIEKIGFVYGMSYLAGLIYIIPFISRIFPNLSGYTGLSSILNNYLVIWGDASLGGNMYAELFYNFGWFSLAVSVLIAKIYTTIDKKVLNYRQGLSLPFWLYVMYIFLLYVRGNVGEVTIYFRCLLIVWLVMNIHDGKLELIFSRD